MSTNCSKYSERRAGLYNRVDVAALSPVARRKVYQFDLVGITLTNGVSHNIGAFGIAGKVVAAYATNRTVGTYTGATLKLQNKTQALDLTTTLDPSAIGSGSVATAFGMAATPPANLATDAIVLVAAGTFTTQPVELVLTIVVDPTEDAVIVD